ncbi:MAG: hypothetical protein JG769_1094 [Oscillospiraceae bacterium]|jgi:beta-xylosidase/AraC-like DNA-binding protein|nr:hypothetical protein [Oscillospiraceae bacterium]
MKVYTDFDFQINKEVIENEYLHPDIELIYVLEGNLKITIKDKLYSLTKEDIVLINSSFMHSINCDGNAIFCRIYYSYFLISKIIKNDNFIFLCNSVSDSERSYAELKGIFKELLYYYIKQPHKTECLINSLLYKLLDNIIENFQIEKSNQSANNSDDERLQKIINYINKNFEFGLNFKALADELYISASTLSRLFKKQTGLYLSDYVNQVRMKHAAIDLLYSDKNITKIATDCGFSNPSVFNKIFREAYGVSPSDYRSKMKEKIIEKTNEEELLRENLRLELKEKEIFNENNLSEIKYCVKASANQGFYFKKNWDKVINIGSLHNLTLANLQYHTLYLVEQLGFSYARLWNVFSAKMMITDGKNIGNYNYDNVDLVLDFLVSNHIIPFLDFGKRPNTAVCSEGNSVFYEEECITFQSRKAWESALENFLQHIIKRYGQNEVNKWIFEFSCDRIHKKESAYYNDKNYSYFEAFKYAYDSIKHLLPNAEIGGPLGIIDFDFSFLKAFLSYCKNNNCLPDFLSFLLFPYKTVCKNDLIISKRVFEKNFEIKQIEMMHELLEESNIKNCKLYISEWNNSLSSRNYLNDSCFRAAYIAKTASEIYDKVDLLSIWVGSDWLSKYYDSFGISNGGNGLLTKDSIRKPAYYAFLFMNRLGEQLIEKNDYCIITKDEKQNYSILCFNFKWYDGNYFLQEENSFTPEKINDIFENNSPVDLEIILQDMPSNQKYSIKKYTINNSSGSILNEWSKFQYENELRNDEVKYLREICVPNLSMEKQIADNGVLRIKTRLQPHEISLIHIYDDTK